MLRVEVRAEGAKIVHHDPLLRDQTRVGFAHELLPQHLDAVICRCDELHLKFGVRESHPLKCIFWTDGESLNSNERVV